MNLKQSIKSHLFLVANYDKETGAVTLEVVSKWDGVDV